MKSKLRRPPSVIIVLLAAWLVVGCQSQLDKCKATTDETAARALAACKDAACKQKAEADRKAYYEACESAAKK
jgi:hypothetical protein